MEPLSYLRNKEFRSETKKFISRTVYMIIFGGAAIQAMVSSIKSNARKRMSLFDKNKGSITSRISSLRKPITSKKLSLKQKIVIAKKLRKQRITRMIKVYSTLALIIVSLIFFFYYS